MYYSQTQSGELRNEPTALRAESWVNENCVREHWSNYYKVKLLKIDFSINIYLVMCLSIILLNFE